MFKKIFQTLLILLVLCANNSFAEAKQTEKNTAIKTKKNALVKKNIKATGRLHWHGDRYIFKDEKTEKLYILLENEILGKWIQSINPLATYEVEGNVYSFQENRYLIPSQYKCKQITAPETLEMGSVSEKKLLRTKKISNLAKQKKNKEKKEIDKSKDKSKKEVKKDKSKDKSKKEVKKDKSKDKSKKEVKKDKSKDKSKKEVKKDKSKDKSKKEVKKDKSKDKSKKEVKKDKSKDKSKKEVKKDKSKDKSKSDNSKDKKDNKNQGKEDTRKEIKK